MTAFEALLQGKAAQARLAGEAHREYLAYYDEYFSRLYTYIRYRCNDASTADDITAAVFEKALTQFKRYSPERGGFGAWLFAIARNEVNAHLRSQTRQACLPVEAVSDRAGDDPSPEEALINRERQRELLEALQLLESRERDLLGLKFSVRFTNRQIAALTGLSESNVGVILHRSIQKLRLLMVPVEGEL